MQRTVANKPQNSVNVVCELPQSEKRCIQVPEVEEDLQTVEKCQPVVSDPICRRIELTLPKQVCQDIVYGFPHNPPIAIDI